MSTENAVRLRGNEESTAAASVARTAHTFIITNGYFLCSTGRPNPPTQGKAYCLDWTGYLENDTIVSSKWSIEPCGLNLENDIVTAAKTTVWLLAGQSGSRYVVVIRSPRQAALRRRDRSASRSAKHATAHCDIA